MVDLDKKDRKLLYYLSLNSRESHTQLAKKIGLNKNSIKYRIDRLQKNGVIKQFTIIPNPVKCKLNTFNLLLKFNSDIYENKEIIDYFKKSGFSTLVVTLSGNWDLFVEIMLRDFTEMADWIDEIISHFGNLLNDYKVFFVASAPVREGGMIKEFFQDLDVEKPKPKKKDFAPIDLDDVEKRIIYELSKDSSLPYLQIAKNMDVSLDVIRYRMKNLIDKNVIVRFDTKISLKALGYTKYLCRVKLRGGSKERVGEIKKRISVNDNVEYAFFDVNENNLVFTCAFKNSEEIDHLLRGLRKDFSDLIADQEYLLIKETVLLDLFPKGMLE
ncbi:MAG: Lrp/AsnC family transcriptional regulator [archaeon]